MNLDIIIFILYVILAFLILGICIIVGYYIMFAILLFIAAVATYFG